MSEYRPRLNKTEFDLVQAYRKMLDDSGDDNVLVISDLHEPFSRNDSLEWIKEVYTKWNCTKVVFSGDIIDNHYASFHTEDPDGYGGGEELDRAIDRIAEWYKVFPKADVITGNHDRIIMRKAFESKIPAQWIKDYPEVLKTPGWKFHESLYIGDILFVHGEGTKAHKRALHNRISVVQGHWHSESYVEWLPSETDRVFAMQVGCLVDQESYAMAYAKHFPRRFIIGCGVILNAKSDSPVPINLTKTL